MDDVVERFRAWTKDHFEKSITRKTAIDGLSVILGENPQAHRRAVADAGTVGLAGRLERQVERAIQAQDTMHAKNAAKLFQGDWNGVIRLAKSAVAALRASTATWRAMDSAPTDGREILLVVRGKVKIASWYEPWGVWIESHDNVKQITDKDDRFGIGSKLPTGWMNVPEVE